DARSPPPRSAAPWSATGCRSRFPEPCRWASSCSCRFLPENWMGESPGPISTPGTVPTVFLLPPSGLLEELQDAAASLVRLRQHRRAGLGQDLVLRELHHLGRHVDVLDRSL